MITNELAAKLGIIPVTNGPARFAVGPPNGITSNAWRIWATRHGDVYIACRDNFKEVKVSLHASGRWRIGFTTEAIAKNRDLLPADQNRAWDIWDKPPASLPNTIIAFRLLFPASELAVRPEQRPAKKWKNVLFVEASPPGKLTVMTLYVTTGEVNLVHESEPSFCLASLDIGNNRRAQLIAHSKPEADIMDIIENSVTESRRQAESKGIEIPKGAFAYFFGQHGDGSRFIVGARMNRDESK